MNQVLKENQASSGTWRETGATNTTVRGDETQHRGLRGNRRRSALLNPALAGGLLQPHAFPLCPRTLDDLPGSSPRPSAGGAANGT